MDLISSAQFRRAFTQAALVKAQGQDMFWKQYSPGNHFLIKGELVYEGSDQELTMAVNVIRGCVINHIEPRTIIPTFLEKGGTPELFNVACRIACTEYFEKGDFSFPEEFKDKKDTLNKAVSSNHPFTEHLKNNLKVGDTIHSSINFGRKGKKHMNGSVISVHDEKSLSGGVPIGFVAHIKSPYFKSGEGQVLARDIHTHISQEGKTYTKKDFNPKKIQKNLHKSKGFDGDQDGDVDPSKGTKLSKAWNDHLAQNLSVGDKVKGKEGETKYKGKVKSVGSDFVDIKLSKKGTLKSQDNATVNKNSITSHKQIEKNPNHPEIKTVRTYKKKSFEKAVGDMDPDQAIHEKSKEIAKSAGISHKEYKGLHPGTKKELYNTHLKNLSTSKNLTKAYYQDNPENRKLGRVGKEYDASSHQDDQQEILNHLDSWAKNNLDEYGLYPAGKDVIMLTFNAAYNAMKSSPESLKLLLEGNQELAAEIEDKLNRLGFNHVRLHPSEKDIQISLNN